MKKLLLFAASTLAASIFYSCEGGFNELADNSGQNTIEKKEVILTATLEDDVQTKTFRDATDGMIYWNPGDEISLFYGSGENGGSKFTSQNEENAYVANFKGSVDVITLGNDIGLDDTYFWGLYPYDPNASCNGEVITTTLPDVQYAKPGTFDDDLFITMGRSAGLRMSFKLVCSGLKFTLSDPNINKVVLSSLDGTPLAGQFNVTMEDNGNPSLADVLAGKSSVTLLPPVTRSTFAVDETYYFVVLPTTLSSGMRLTFYNKNGDIAVKNFNSQTFTRGVFKTASKIDTGIQYNEPVDLGFGVLWAPFNIGASKPTEVGDYFAYGETATKSTYTSANYTAPGIDKLDQAHDAAYQQWGYKWRIPTKEEFLYLVEHTTHQWVTNYNNTGIAGYILTSEVPGYTDKSIFLPVTGIYQDAKYNPSYGYYRLDEANYWGLLNIEDSENPIGPVTNVSELINYGGMPIRPVQDFHATDMWLILSETGETTTSLDAFIYPYAVYELRPRFDDDNAVEIDDVEWSFNGDDCIQVNDSDDESISFCCTSPGVSTITATAAGGALSASCTVTVYDARMMITKSNNEMVEAPSTIFPYAADGRWKLTNSNELVLSLKYYDGYQYKSLDNDTEWYPTYDNDNLTADVKEPNTVSLSSNVGGVYTYSVMIAIDDGVNEDPFTIFNKEFKIVMTQPSKEEAIDLGEAVDLGLSTNWAPFNLGSCAPDLDSDKIFDYGVPFAWGEIDTKDTFTQDNYSYVHNGESVLPLSADAAHAIWGGDWRTPTIAEWDELRTNCTWVWTDDYEGTGNEGFVVTGKKEGFTDKSIFIGFTNGEKGNTGIGRYHSASRLTFVHYAINIGQNEYTRTNDYNYKPRFIRPVCGYNKVVSVTISGSHEVPLGNTPTQLTATVETVGSASKNVTWSVSDESVATIDQNGRVTGKKVGTTTVIATSMDGAAYGEHTINVTSNVTEVNLTSLASVNVNESITLTATVLPLSAFSQRVVWSVANENVATITDNGVLTGLTPGVTTVRATSIDGVHYGTCRVSVYDNNVEVVDFGMKSGNKWAVKNIGAVNANAPGIPFAKGETGTKSTFTESNYSGTDLFDTATEILGPRWKTPSYADWQELFEYTTQMYWSGGIRFYSLDGTKHIDIPFAGYQIGTTVIGGTPSTGAYYWTSTKTSGHYNTLKIEYAAGESNPFSYSWPSIPAYAGAVIRAVWHE